MERHRAAVSISPEGCGSKPVECCLGRTIDKVESARKCGNGSIRSGSGASTRPYAGADNSFSVRPGPNSGLEASFLPQLRSFPEAQKRGMLAVPPDSIPVTIRVPVHDPKASDRTLVPDLDLAQDIFDIVRYGSTAKIQINDLFSKRKQ